MSDTETVPVSSEAPPEPTMSDVLKAIGAIMGEVNALKARPAETVRYVERDATNENTSRDRGRKSRSRDDDDRPPPKWKLVPATFNGVAMRRLVDTNDPYGSKPLSFGRRKAQGLVACLKDLQRFADGIDE